MTDANPETTVHPFIEALLRRRSVPKVRDEQPSRTDIKMVLDAAVAAPNHHRTNPWRFVVLAGEARVELGTIMATTAVKSLEDPNSAEAEAAMQRERSKPMRAPIVIAVAAVPTDDPRAIEVEEISATSAAVENMLMACEALGLAAMWRTGSPARDPAVKAFLGLPPEAQIVAFVYVGYPDIEVPPRDYRSAEPYTTWMGWDD